MKYRLRTCKNLITTIVLMFKKEKSILPVVGTICSLGHRDSLALYLVCSAWHQVFDLSYLKLGPWPLLVETWIATSFFSEFRYCDTERL